jgi:hypothetical protein
MSNDGLKELSVSPVIIFLSSFFKIRLKVQWGFYHICSKVEWCLGYLHEGIPVLVHSGIVTSLKNLVQKTYGLRGQYCSAENLGMWPSYWSRTQWKRL